MLNLKFFITRDDLFKSGTISDTEENRKRFNDDGLNELIGTIIVTDEPIFRFVDNNTGKAVDYLPLSEENDMDKYHVKGIDDDSGTLLEALFNGILNVTKADDKYIYFTD